MFYKTIKEIADEIGVSKQTVFNRLKDPEIALKLEGHTILDGVAKTISPEGVELIKERFSSISTSKSTAAATTTVNVATPSVDPSVLEFLKSTVELLQEQLTRKDEQIAEKDYQINQLQDRLSESHQFSIKTQQMMASMQIKAIEASTVKPKGFLSNFRRKLE